MFTLTGENGEDRVPEIASVTTVEDIKPMVDDICARCLDATIRATSANRRVDRLFEASRQELLSVMDTDIAVNRNRNPSYTTLDALPSP